MCSFVLLGLVYCVFCVGKFSVCSTWVSLLCVLSGLVYCVYIRLLCVHHFRACRLNQCVHISSVCVNQFCVCKSV